MDWTKFTRKIRLNASPQRIYNSWTETTELTKWFLKEVVITEGSTDGICRKGDKVNWHWHNVDSIESVIVLEANGKDEISFTFGGVMEVHISIIEEGSKSVLSLVQLNIPTEDTDKMNFYAGCSNGWTFWLANLKAYLEHNIVLHDTKLGNRDGLFDYINT